MTYDPDWVVEGIAEGGFDTHLGRIRLAVAAREQAQREELVRRVAEVFGPGARIYDPTDIAAVPPSEGEPAKSQPLDPNYKGPGIYRHYKGGEYAVLGLALREDSLDKENDPCASGEVFVVYEPLSPGSLLGLRAEDFWARRLDDFDAHVQRDAGDHVRRFEFVSGPEDPPGRMIEVSVISLDLDARSPRVHIFCNGTDYWVDAGHSIMVAG